ncbi:MAG TPA: metal-dependent transcriptional regulator [Candidatus Wallbacteria bacterium]|nr:MAG: Iron-dependent repressor IdeR [bacterium ADurb.Bin243]HPG56805.1 metal-dependent transcriptional regulator [Candidatus Wallbacteria bacterium]
MTEISHELEEAMTIIWKHIENGDDSFEAVDDKLKKYIGEDVLKRLMSEGYVKNSRPGGRIEFNEKGYSRAYDLTRRHRLTERLLVDVLHMDRSRVDSDACMLEHIISRELEENICTLLGHPQVCPHGSRILPGECCKNKASKIERVIFKLSELKHGECGRVSYIQTQTNPVMHKIMSLGLVPGLTIKVHSSFPAYVVEFEQTQLALETEVAENIFVRKIS